MTDEGQRQLKVLDFSVEWYNLEHIPLIQLHFLTNRSPPLISQPVPKCRLTASPRGKPRDASPLAVHKLLVRTVYCPYGKAGSIQRAARFTDVSGRLLVAPTGCGAYLQIILNKNTLWCLYMAGEYANIPYKHEYFSNFTQRMTVCTP